MNNSIFWTCRFPHFQVETYNRTYSRKFPRNNWMFVLALTDKNPYLSYERLLFARKEGGLLSPGAGSEDSETNPPVASRFLQSSLHSLQQTSRAWRRGRVLVLLHRQDRNYRRNACCFFFLVSCCTSKSLIALLTRGIKPSEWNWWFPKTKEFYLRKNREEKYCWICFSSLRPFPHEKPLLHN